MSVSSIGSTSNNQLVFFQNTQEKHLDQTIQFCTHRCIPLVGISIAPALKFFSLIQKTTSPDLFDKGFKILKKGGHPIELSSSTNGESHVMLLAAMYGNVELINHLYKKDPTLIDLGTDWGATPLLIAVLFDQPLAVEALLDLGANPNIATTNSRIISLYKGKLLKLGWEFNQGKTKNNFIEWDFIPKNATPLWIAIQRSYPTASTIMIYQGTISSQLRFDDSFAENRYKRIASKIAIVSAIGLTNLFTEETIELILDYWKNEENTAFSIKNLPP